MGDENENQAPVEATAPADSEAPSVEAVTSSEPEVSGDESEAVEAVGNPGEVVTKGPDGSLITNFV